MNVADCVWIFYKALKGGSVSSLRKTPSVVAAETERESSASLVQIAFRLFFGRQGFAGSFSGSCKKSCWPGRRRRIPRARYSQFKRHWRAAKEIIAKNLRATRCSRRKLIKMLTAKTLVCVGRFHYGQRRARMARNLVVVLVAQFLGHCERYTKQAACVSRL